MVTNRATLKLASTLQVIYFLGMTDSSFKILSLLFGRREGLANLLIGL